MESTRKSEEVVNQLLRAMTETVTTYHPTVKLTSGSIDGLIAGTACFPGGAGLWRGGANGGSLPVNFPHRPVMFVGHNFDSQRGFDRSFEQRGEVGGQFWQRLLGVLKGAGIQPDDCFFTNALMGLKPGNAEGAMPSVRPYKNQCQRFLRLQVEIVKPRAVIALGVNAEKYVLRLDCRYLSVKHPSGWSFCELATREERLLAEGRRVGEFLSKSHELSNPPSTTTLERESRMPTKASQQKGSGEDAWGFRCDTRQSYLMQAIESGGKSKETIKSEFLRAYLGSTGTSTFDVFFSDLVRPFGSASASRSIRIETDPRGHIYPNPERALVVKAAVAKGMLKEINAVNKGVWPKREDDRRPIEAILFRYGVPLK